MAKKNMTQDEVEALAARKTDALRHELQEETGGEWTFVLTYKATPKKKPVVSGRSVTTVPVAQSNGAKVLAAQNG